MNISINKEQIRDLEHVKFTGNIYVIDQISQVKPAIAVLRKNKLVGFDTETRPSFKKGVLNKVALMQLSTYDDCFLFRLNKIGFPVALIDYLTDASSKKVGLSLHDDFNMLNHRTPITPQGFVDLQDIVGEYGIRDISLQKIYAILFDGKISKSQRLTNWDAPELTLGQCQYAALDAWACIKIYDYLIGGEFNPAESKYIIEDEQVV